MKKGLESAPPSKASLKEIPEVNFSRVRVTRNPYAARIAVEGMVINVRRGRPRKGTETGLTVPKSIRFPAPIWTLLEQRARRNGLTLHAALRAAILEWAGRGDET